MNIKKSNINTTPLSHGFTLVEMLIVAPVVILVIGVFISVIINMTGDVLAARSSNAIAYNVQDALNSVKQDVALSGGYLATNNFVVTAPQGYDNNSLAFKNIGQGKPALILNSYATENNPSSLSRKILYLANQPNPCDSDRINENPAVMINVVYFIKDNILWRRVVMPSNYTDGACKPPWQQPSCSAISSGSFCKAKDKKIIEGITDLKIEYFTSAGSDSPVVDINKSEIEDALRQNLMQKTNTIGITMTVNRNIAGRDITQTGTIKAVSPNSNTSRTIVNTAVLLSMSKKVLVVAGGGGSGISSPYQTFCGGGGGAGGLIYSTNYTFTPGQSIPIIVGGGGGGADNTGNNTGSKGINSTFGSLTAIGGGGGGSGFKSTPSTGGSGGGAGCPTGYSEVVLGSSGTVGQGNSGGSSLGRYLGGGGGGAGSDGSSGEYGGGGGGGLLYTISGSSKYYATGGAFGGGSAGTANSGNGGSNGGNIGSISYAGGSGVIIVSYPTGSMVATGGTITYTDSKNLNPRSDNPYTDGFTIHTFKTVGASTFNVSQVN